MTSIQRRRQIAPHHKVRTGCERCKQRRVKCDETQPMCRNCSLAGRICLYQQSLPSYPIFAGNTTVHQGLVRFSARDLELLHHWMIATAATIGGTEELRVSIRDVLPTEAFAKPYLLHLILAVSALHLAYLKPSQYDIYSVLGRYHYASGLPLFRENLKFLDGSNCHALYGCSQLISKYVLATDHHPQRLLLSPPNREVADWRVLIRGSYMIRDTNVHLLQQGPMASMARDVLHSSSNITLNEPFLERLQAITNIIQISTANGKHLNTYMHTLHIFKQVSAQAARPDQKATIKALFMAGLAQIPIDFWDQLQKREPEALLILAHYCILLERMNNDSVWYMKGWSRLLFNECLEGIDECWMPLLDWPLAMLR